MSNPSHTARDESSVAAYPTPPPGGLIAGDPRPDTAWAGVSEEVREESARLLDRAAGIPEPSPRVVLVTLAVLLPAECSDVSVDEIVPVGLRCEGWFEDTELTDFIEVEVQEAKLEMT